MNIDQPLNLPGVSRREAMRLGLAGAAGLLLGNKFASPAFASAPALDAVMKPPLVAKAKAVIQI